MKAEKVFCMRQGWHWIAQGNGELRPILVEADTREEATQAWLAMFGRQYEEAQCLTNRSLMAQGAL